VGLATLIGPELIFPDLGGSDIPTVLRNLAEGVAEAGRVDDADRLYQKLWEREQLARPASARASPCRTAR
jgi:mannitol/fructose-specific phosphotransferase system IIA component (Ntr-type)